VPQGSSGATDSQVMGLSAFGRCDGKIRTERANGGRAKKRVGHEVATQSVKPQPTNVDFLFDTRNHSVPDLRLAYPSMVAHGLPEIPLHVVHKTVPAG